MTDDIYFMRTDEGHVKIGRAVNVDKRLTQIQTGCPHEIIEVRSLPGRGHEEKDWHENFAAHRVRGEWFRWTPAMERAIDRAGNGRSWRRDIVPDEAVNDLYLKTFGVTYTDLKERAVDLERLKNMSANSKVKT